MARREKNRFLVQPNTTDAKRAHKQITKNRFGFFHLTRFFFIVIDHRPSGWIERSIFLTAEARFIQLAYQYINWVIWRVPKRRDQKPE